MNGRNDCVSFWVDIGRRGALLVEGWTSSGFGAFLSASVREVCQVGNPDDVRRAEQSLLGNVIEEGY